MRFIQIRPIVLAKEVEAVKNIRALRHAPIDPPKIDSISKGTVASPQLSRLHSIRI
jgi:hypothetical protein